MLRKSLILIVLVFLAIIDSYGQDMTLYQIRDKIPSTILNPAFKTTGKFNISVMNFQAGLSTDGPSFNSLTSKNSEGRRYFDVRNLNQPLSDEQNIEFSNEINTIDLSVQIGSIRLSAGHSFKANGMLTYPKAILEVASQGNAAFIGQTLPIGVKTDVTAFNQLYLGAQMSFGRLSLGARAKVLYGTAVLYSEKSKVDFTTLPEFYQTQVETDFIYRSSSLLGYNGIDDVKNNYDGFTFDNLFYNNRGFGIDLGVNYEINDKASIMASVNDINTISWDYEPRKYSSQGNFVFEGADIFDVLVDSTEISIIDSLKELLNVQTTKEEFSKSAPMTFNLGFNYNLSESLSLQFLHQYRQYELSSTNITSVGVMKNFGIINVGGTYTVTKNSYTNVGLTGSVLLGPLHVYAGVDNVVGMFQLLDSKRANARLGASFSF